LKTYDAIILGLGAMGSAATLELIRRNISCIAFDQFAPPHGLGSHSGQTRIFRLAHYDTPKYVPLAQRAGRLWDQLSEEFSHPLLMRIGLLKMGPPGDGLIEGIRQCGAEWGLPVETLLASEVRYRYPAFQIPDEFVGVLEAGAGWIDVDTAIRGMQGKARDMGAELCLNEAVLDWTAKGQEVTVRTATREIHASRLVITAGAWATHILHDLSLPIRILGKTFFWFDPLEPLKFSDSAIPIFGFPPRIFYGFPNIRRQGVKVAEHLGGEALNPDDQTEGRLEPDYKPILETVTRFTPGLAGPPPGDPSRIAKTSACLYAMTSDEHPIIDVHPRFPNVIYAAGFSGHGFKFTPLIGEVLADLALGGRTQHPVEFLRASRFTSG
jgi:sarcosine oxidase